MNDNQLITAVITTIEDQLTLVGESSFEVARNFQPSNQFSGGDADSDIKTQVFLHAITSPVIGRSRKYNATQDKRADLQHKSKLIQVSVLHSFDYKDEDSKTPEDMCGLIRDLLDSPDAIKSLRARGVFLQEVGEPRPMFFVNDKDQNESSPNFDLTVTYRSEIIKDSGFVNTISGNIQGEGI